MSDSNSPESSSSKDPSSRPKIIRDVIVFQVKLWLEGFKDLALMPLSGGAALIDFVFGSRTLYAVMRLGDRFEQWVDLYGALGTDAEKDLSDRDLRSLDHLLNEAADGIEEAAIRSRTETNDAAPSES